MVLEAIFDYSTGAPAFYCGTSTGLCVNLLAESNGAPAIVSLANKSGADATDSSAHPGMLNGGALPGKSAGGLVFVVSVKVNENFLNFFIPILFSVTRKMKSLQRLETFARLGTTRETPWRRPPRSHPPFGKEISPPADVKEETTQVEAVPSDGAPDTIDTAVWVIKI